MEREVVEQVQLQLLEHVLLLVQDGPDLLLLGRGRLAGGEVREVGREDQPTPGEEELEVKALPQPLLERVESEGRHLVGGPVDQG